MNLVTDKLPLCAPVSAGGCGSIHAVTESLVPAIIQLPVTKKTQEAAGFSFSEIRIHRISFRTEVGKTPENPRFSWLLLPVPTIRGAETPLVTPSVRTLTPTSSKPRSATDRGLARCKSYNNLTPNDPAA